MLLYFYLICHVPSPTKLSRSLLRTRKIWSGLHMAGTRPVVVCVCELLQTVGRSPSEEVVTGPFRLE
jgi:hypothetical protein